MVNVILLADLMKTSLDEWKDENDSSFTYTDILMLNTIEMYRVHLSNQLR
jgi:hypothetical protein